MDGAMGPSDPDKTLMLLNLVWESPGRTPLVIPFISCRTMILVSATRQSKNEEPASAIGPAVLFAMTNFV